MVFKFGTLAQKEWQTMYDLAKMFLHCLNHWKLWPPASRGQQLDEKDENDYKLNYTRLDRLTLWIKKSLSHSQNSLVSLCVLVTLILDLAGKTWLCAVCKLTYLFTQINIFFFFCLSCVPFTSAASMTEFWERNAQCCGFAVTCLYLHLLSSTCDFSKQTLLYTLLSWMIEL